MRISIMKVTKFLKWAWSGLMAIYRGIRNMSRGQERALLITLIALSWVVSGRHTASKAEQLVAVATPPPVVEEIAEPVVVEAPKVNEDAEAVARVLYGIRNNDTVELEAVVWCIVNRVESPLYPSTVIDVCTQPSQWMGYSDDNPVLDNLYDIACSVLDTWDANGHRPFGNEYLYLTWSPDQITLRTSFEETKSCKYYRAG
jgi:hypothetical protein